MVDVSEVGKYGTIRLMKTREPDVCVASFPIDEDTVTFGRQQDCSIRLYYPWVSSLHCKIIFEEKKAFLQVFGTNGIVYDGLQILPSKSSAPTTIPLINGTTFDIYKKRFKFSYPPKEMRPQLFTPVASKRRKSLRMSMINSAQVFTPRPSSNPKENLRILQSPLKPFMNAGAKGQMIKEADGEEDEDGELEIAAQVEDVQPEEMVRLVDGNHPKVFETEQDLIIFEDVEPPPPVVASHEAPQSPGPSQQNGAMGLQSPIKPQNVPPHVNFTNKQPRTPRRRSAPSLHRAVLIRSAQRAAMKQEVMQMQKLQAVNFGAAVGSSYGGGGGGLDEHDEDMDAEGEDDDETEVEEVEEAVSAILEEEDEDLYADDDGPFGDAQSVGLEEVPEAQGPQGGDDDDAMQDGNGDMNEDAEELEQDITDSSLDDDAEEDEETHQEAPPQVMQTTPTRPPRTLFGAFMTPQTKTFPNLSSTTDTESNATDPVHAGPQRPPPGSRFSLGAGLVGMFTPWKIKDVIALENANVKTSEVEGREEKEEQVEVKKELTEEEKNAIRLRRRSEAVAPTPDFTHVPGTRRTSALPGPINIEEVSPFKSIRKGLDEGEDTQEALKRLKAQVEGWKSKEGSTPVSPVRKVNIFGSSTPAPVPIPAPTVDNDLSANTSTRSESGFSLFSPAAKRYGPAAIAARRMALGVGSSAGFGKNLFGESDVVMEETGSQLRREEEQDKVMELEINKKDEARYPKSGTMPSTPRLDGLRTLFRQPVQPPPTPYFGGVKEMLDIPEEAEQKMDDKDGDKMQEDVEEPQNNTAPSLTSRKPPSKTRSTPARAASSRTRSIASAATDASTMADDEETSADMTFSSQTQGSARKKRGTRGVTVDDPIVEDEGEEKVEESKPRTATRGKGKKAAAVKEDASDDEMNIATTSTDVDTGPVPTKATSRIARLTTATTKAARTTAARTTRTRPASVEPTNDESTDAPAAPKTRTRKPRSRTESTDVEMEAETTQELPVEVMRVGPPRGVRKATSTTTTVPKSTSRIAKLTSGTGLTRKARTTTVEESGKSTDRPPSPEVEVLKPVKPASKTTSRRGRPAATTVDVDETIAEEDELGLKAEKPASKLATLKNRRTKAITESENSQAGSATTAKKRAPVRRAASKTPSPVEDSSIDDVGKENDRPVLPTKSRTVTTKGRSKATVASESDDVAVARPAARTRTTRARK